MLVEARCGHVFAARVRRAGPLARTLGLAGRPAIDRDEGLWFEGCRAIHTLGMRAAIDVALLDDDGTVVHVVRGVPPARPAVIAHPRARAAVETGAGGLAGVLVGDRLAVR